MLAAMIQGFFEGLAEIIFLTLGVRRTLALIFLAIGLVAMNSGKFESSGIFLGVSACLGGWDTIVRKRARKQS